MKFILTVLITVCAFTLSAQQLPPASSCATAINLSGCTPAIPNTFKVQAGPIDSGFIKKGINQGCFVNPHYHYTFFYFVAGADGKFGFIARGADAAQPFDFEFNVWGPINSLAEACDFVAKNQPVRSSWSGGADPTGLADVHPVSGINVTDDFDCATVVKPSSEGDDVVRRLDVQKGKVYVILLDDLHMSAQNAGITLDLSGTTPGVLQPLEQSVSITADTAICPGNSIQLNADGGYFYEWTPVTGLSCTTCPNPLTGVSNTPVTYSVNITNACAKTTLSTTISPITFNLGPDIIVCREANVVLNTKPVNGKYVWTGSAGLSCTDCPSPKVSTTANGTFTYFAELTTTDCVLRDTIQVRVFNGVQTKYNIINDTTICKGKNINIGGEAIAGTFYTWTSKPGTFNSSVANPFPPVFETTVFYLNAASGQCPFASRDSVVVTVKDPPVTDFFPDTSVCNGNPVVLGNKTALEGYTFSWSPNTDLDNDKAANPIARAQQSTLYRVTITDGICEVVKQTQIAVTTLDLTILPDDTVLICKGAAKEVNLTVNPSGTTITWAPIQGLTLSPDGLKVSVLPEETTLYTATAIKDKCVREVKLFAKVDSLPDLQIMPKDTQVCEGNPVLLKSKTFQPSAYPGITFEWIPLKNQQSPDSLFNLVVQPDTTTIYERITTIGGCLDTSRATINVIPYAKMEVTPAESTICPGQSIALKLTYDKVIENIEWTPNQTLSCDDCDNPIATPVGTTQYNVKGEFMGCTSTASALVIVRPLPVVNLPGKLSICKGDSVQLNTIIEGNTTYEWTSTDPAFGTKNIGNPFAKPTQTTTYFLKANNGCPMDTSVTLTFFGADLKVSNDTTVCRNFPVKLTAAGSLPGAYRWSNNETTQATTVSTAQDQTYSVTYTYGPGCTLTDEVTVKIDGVGADVVFPTDREICPGESVKLNTGFTPGATYVWSSVPPLPNPNQFDPTVSPTQNTTYTLTATNGKCVSTNTITIIAHRATLTASRDTTVCGDQPLVLTAKGTSTGTYRWSNNATTESISLLPAVAGTYSVTFTYGDQCTLTENVVVVTKPAISVSLVVDPDTNVINLGETFDLTAIIQPTQTLTNFNFMWTEDGVPLTGNSEGITIKPNTTKTEEIPYGVKVTSPDGCVARAFVLIRIAQPLVFVPNAFTPNGDGTNDRFRLGIAEGLVTVESIEVYDRWGKKVFDGNQNNPAWDGNVDDKPAPPDVYVYVIRWRDGAGALKIEKGGVALLR